MFQRISNLIRGFLNLFIGGMEKQNPEALLEVEKENLRKQIANYNQGLAAHAGLCERLMNQVRKQEEEEKDLNTKATAHLRAGNRDAAGQYALRLQTVQHELQENRTQLQGAEASYQELTKARDVAIKAAKDKIEALKFSLSDLKVKRATAELTEMATGMISTIGGAGETLDRLHGMVEEEREKAAGRVRVAKDSFNVEGVDLKETEQKALQEQALADFAAKSGVNLEPKAPNPATPETQSPSAPAPKTMGPVSE